MLTLSDAAPEEIKRAARVANTMEDVILAAKCSLADALMAIGFMLKVQFEDDDDLRDALLQVYSAAYHLDLEPVARLN